MHMGWLYLHRSGRVLQLLIGDDSGARVELEVPFAPEHSDIRIGDIAHLVVVSDRPDMSRFRVVREAYIPEARYAGPLVVPSDRSQGWLLTAQFKLRSHAHIYAKQQTRQRGSCSPTASKTLHGLAGLCKHSRREAMEALFDNTTVLLFEDPFTQRAVPFNRRLTDRRMHTTTVHVQGLGFRVPFLGALGVQVHQRPVRGATAAAGRLLTKTRRQFIARECWLRPPWSRGLVGDELEPTLRSQNALA